MKRDVKAMLARREFLRAVGVGAGAAVAAAALPADEAAADSESYDERRKARYQANAADVQSFYRVNRYPAK